MSTSKHNGKKLNSIVQKKTHRNCNFKIYVYVPDKKKLKLE